MNQVGGATKPTPDQLKALTRGTVVRVDLAGAKGREQMKIRHAVVVSSDRFNRNLDTMQFVPLSGLKNKTPYPHEVLVPKGEGGTTEDSVAQAVQVRTLDRYERVVEIMGTLRPETMAKISVKLFEVLGGLG